MNDGSPNAHPDPSDDPALEAREAAQVQATLDSAPRIHRLSRILRTAGAVAVALSLLAGLAMAVVMLSKGFGGAGEVEAPDASGGSSGAIRSSEP